MTEMNVRNIVFLYAENKAPKLMQSQEMGVYFNIYVEQALAVPRFNNRKYDLKKMDTKNWLVSFLSAIRIISAHCLLDIKKK